MVQTHRMFVLQPVLEVYALDGFALWPVTAPLSYGFLPLNGALSPEGVGTAVMRIAERNDVGPEDGDLHPQRPPDPLGSFLHGLLTMEDLSAPGGLRITDTTTGTILMPGCCNGLDERRDWRDVLDGDGWASFGHDPFPLAERVGDMVRLTVDAQQDDSPVIELPAADMRRLLTGAEHDLSDFLQLVAAWAAEWLPDHDSRVTAAIACALDLPSPGAPSRL